MRRFSWLSKITCFFLLISLSCPAFVWAGSRSSEVFSCLSPRINANNSAHKEYYALLAQNSVDELVRASGLDLAVWENNLKKKFREKGFVITEIIGAGGNSFIYHAVNLKNPDLPREVALKIKRPYLQSRISSPERIEDIVLRLGAGHPNIIKIYAAGKFVNGVTYEYHVLELVKGKSVEERISEGFFDRITLAQAVKIFQDLCSACAYMHERRIPHADFKNENIMITDEGTVKIVDIEDIFYFIPSRERVELGDEYFIEKAKEFDRKALAEVFISILANKNVLLSDIPHDWRAIKKILSENKDSFLAEDPRYLRFFAELIARMRSSGFNSIDEIIAHWNDFEQETRDPAGSARLKVLRLFDKVAEETDEPIMLDSWSLALDVDALLSGEMSEADIVQEIRTELVYMKKIFSARVTATSEQKQALSNAYAVLRKFYHGLGLPFMPVPVVFVNGAQVPKGSLGMFSHYYRTILFRGQAKPEDLFFLLLHEGIHANAKGFIRERLNEGMVEYLRNKILMQATGRTKISFQEFLEHYLANFPSKYAVELKTVFLLMLNFGEEPLLRAFLSGDYRMLERVLGKEFWQEIQELALRYENASVDEVMDYGQEFIALLKKYKPDANICDAGDCRNVPLEKMLAWENMFLFQKNVLIKHKLEPDVQSLSIRELAMDQLGPVVRDFIKDLDPLDYESVIPFLRAGIRLVPEGRGRMFQAQVNGQVAGLFYLSYDEMKEQRTAKLIALAVKEEWRQNGVFKQLLFSLDGIYPEFERISGVFYEHSQTALSRIWRRIMPRNEIDFDNLTRDQFDDLVALNAQQQQGFLQECFQMIKSQLDQRIAGEFSRQEISLPITEQWI